MNYRSIADMSNVIRNHFFRVIPGDVELIIGVPRSGMLPATMLAEYMNVPLMSLDMFEVEDNPRVIYSGSRIAGREGTRVSDLKHIMVIDDSCALGTAMEKTKTMLNAKLPESVKVTYGCVYALTTALEHVDFYFEIVENPRVFEWNIMNHYLLGQTCMDMDGVLCVDPTDEENDDGERYIEFMEKTAPIFIPKYKIGAIVTSRLEKYRSNTEAWLKKHNVQYENLIMLNLPDAETRRRMGAHASFKAMVLQKLQGVLFIESEPYQAEAINEVTGTPVYCTGNNRMYDKMKKQREKKEKELQEARQQIGEILETVRELQVYLQSEPDAQTPQYWLNLCSEVMESVVLLLNQCGQDQKAQVFISKSLELKSARSIEVILDIDVEELIRYI